MSLLRPERVAPPAFPGAVVFGKPWGGWIETAAEAKGAPPDYVAGALISVTGSLLGNSRWVSPWDGWSEPPILWAMLVGPPSANKSPGLDAVIEPLRALQKKVAAKIEPHVADWRERAETAKIVKSAWQERVKAAVKDGEEPPKMPSEADPGEKPHIPLLMVNDVTIEKLAELVACQPRGALLVRDEISGWLANMTRYSSGGTDRPTWLECYGGRAYVTERMTRSAHVDRFTVGILGGIQPDPLAALLLNADDDGLLARHLPIWPDLAPIKRPGALPDPAFAEEAFSRLYALEMSNTDDDDLRPRFARFSDEAASLMLEFMKWGREEESREAGLIVSFIGKTRGFAARLALILAHLDWAISANGEAPPHEVTAQHFGRACHFVEEYLLPMARRAYAEGNVAPERRSARRLAKLLHDERVEVFTSSDISRRERAHLRKSAEIDAATNVLVQAGWLRCERQGCGPKGGRPRLVYRTNPNLWGAP